MVSGSAAMEGWYGKITGLCREDGEDRLDGLQLMNSAPFWCPDSGTSGVLSVGKSWKIYSVPKQWECYI